MGKEFYHVVGVTGSFAAARGAEPLWKFVEANLGSRAKAGALLGEISNTFRTVDIILPNTIHGYKKKDI